MQDTFVTDREASEILKTNIRHIRRMYKAGVIRGKDISLGEGKRKTIRLLKEDVIGYTKTNSL